MDLGEVDHHLVHVLLLISFLFCLPWLEELLVNDFSKTQIDLAKNFGLQIYESFYLRRQYLNLRILRFPSC